MIIQDILNGAGKKVRILNIIEHDWFIPDFELAIRGVEPRYFCSGICEGEITGYEIDNVFGDARAKVTIVSLRTGRTYEVTDLSQLEFIVA